MNPNHPITRRLLTLGIPALALAAGAGALAVWLNGGHALALSERPVPTLRLPGQDNAPARAIAKTDFPGTFTPGPGKPADSSATWSAFRGDYRDNIARPLQPLFDQPPPEGIPVLWEIPCGEGYAGPAVRNGRVWLLDHDAEEHADVLRCLSLDDGRELWQRSYRVTVKRQHGFSRTVPAVTDRYVLTLGPKCHVLCVRAETGEFLWGLDLVAKFGCEVPQWYAGQCPLINNGRAILAPAGPDVLMLAVDCETGKTLWTAPNQRNWAQTHSSILPVSFAGRGIYLYCGSGGLAGVDADSGELLFLNEDWTVKIATVPTPVDLGEGRILLVGGYGAGSLLVQLEEQPAENPNALPDILARTVKRLPPQTLGSDQQTPVFFDDHLYAVLPKGIAHGAQLTCLSNTGIPLWHSGPDHTFGLGPYLAVDDPDGIGKALLVMNDEGLLSAVRTTPRGFELLWQADVLDGHEAWAPMSLADGRLLVRDLTTMKCLDLRAARKDAP